VPRRIFVLKMLLMVFIATSAFAKDAPVQTLVWPESGKPVLRFSFFKFKELGSVATERTYVTDTTVENLSSKPIPNECFALYLYNKSKVRIGEGWITLSNVGPGQTVKFQTTIEASGTPVSLSVLEATQVPRTVSLTVNSVPQGAGLKVDGNEVGTTPRIVNVGMGQHILEFSKDGFNAGRFPLEIGLNDVSGGSVSYELGTSSFDTVELRDGSLLSGDLISVSGMDVSIRIGGSTQHIDRNKIKRVMFVERDVPLSDLQQPPTSPRSQE